MKPEADAASPAELVILDVGHGNAAVVHENSTNLLIDAAIGSHVLEYLRQRSITTIDLVVLSHSDQDHIGGLIGLLNAGIRVKSVRLNSDSEKVSETWRDLIVSLEDARRNGDLNFSIGLTSGSLPVEGFESCRSEIVAPTPRLAAFGAGGNDCKGRKITSNSISACIRLLFDDRPVAILTGDMDEIALDEALDARADMQAPVLVFPHHGGLSGTGDPNDFVARLLDAVKPETVVFSVGRAKYDNPRPEIVTAIKQFNAKAHIACTQLSTNCSETLATGARKNPFTIFSAGATKNSCCAGSIAVDLKTSSLASGTQAAHVNFVKRYVQTPLCGLKG